ncbi:hypothetical protein X975_24537, partial [Stegodyphus mimosarum]
MSSKLQLTLGWVSAMMSTVSSFHVGNASLSMGNHAYSGINSRYR